MADIRVLLVDDEAALIEAVQERLQMRGIEASVSTSGQDALKRLKQCPFNVVIVDVRMPELGGLDLLDEINKICPSTRVILLTGRARERERGEAIRRGAFDYLVKPVDIDDLVAAMERAVEAGRTSD